MKAFLKLIKVKFTTLDDIRFECLGSVLDIDQNPQRHVTLDAFEKFLKWFGPIEGPEILEQIKSLVEAK